MTAGLPVSQNAINYMNFLCTAEATIYFIGAGFTAFACIYSLATIPFGWIGKTARHVDLLVTLLSASFQIALGVMSSISTTLFQQNFGAIISESYPLQALEGLVMTESISGMSVMLPMMGLLLFEKFNIFLEGAIQEDRLAFKTSSKLLL